jgi:flagellar P-ring protein precursor FlgI
VVFAVASGAISVEDPALPTRGKVSAGCRMEQNYLNPFVENDKITLVLKPSHARFRVVEDVAFQINSYQFFREESDSQVELAQPVDQMSIEVTIPPEYQRRPVTFAAVLMEVPLTDLPGLETVVVNETTGVIAMSADLEISPYALQHKNMAIEIGDGAVGDQMVAVDPRGQTTMPTLQALVQSLNALRVSAKDMIAIIRTLDRAGAIHGRVIYEN